MRAFHFSAKPFDASVANAHTVVTTIKVPVWASFAIDKVSSDHFLRSNAAVVDATDPVLLASFGGATAKTTPGTAVPCLLSLSR